MIQEIMEKIIYKHNAEDCNCGHSYCAGWINYCRKELLILGEIIEYDQEVYPVEILNERFWGIDHAYEIFKKRGLIKENFE